MRVITFLKGKHVSDETLCIFNTKPTSGCEVIQEVCNKYKIAIIACFVLKMDEVSSETC